MPNPSVILLAVVYYIMTAKSILSEPDILKEVNMTGEEFAKDEKRLSEQVSDYFNTLGNIAHIDTKKIERAENTILLCWQLQSQ